MTEFPTLTLKDFENKIQALGTFTSGFYQFRTLRLVVDKSGHHRFVVRILDDQDQEITYPYGPIAIIHKFDIGRFEISSKAYEFFDDFNIYTRLLRLVTIFAMTDPVDRHDYTVSRWEIENTTHERLAERAQDIKDAQAAAAERAEAEHDYADPDDDDDDEDDDYEF